MKAIGYTRVSTEEQKQLGISLSNQEQKILAYCTAKDWNLHSIIKDEGYSGKNLNRPGIQTIIKGCRRKEFDVVVTLKLDRLTRSVKDLGYLVEDVFNRHGVAFSSLQDNFDTSTANGRMVMNILATLAQWERDIIAERTKDAMQFMKSSLRLVGAVPFGFDLVGRDLTPDPEAMGTVQDMIRMKNSGMSYQKIADHLNGNGVTAKNGGRWHPKTVMGTIHHIRSLPGDHWVIKRYFPEGRITDG
ncbi:MAG TPA: recombinase family protein [Syntrophorhabdus sp.]|nr:recombinase family protein [Syntrophorhabdus sp.]HOH27323.1 recombinase family protein [Syntrophorhabdus sp.]HOQ42820.1 recombinase family protein [Smithellaceae bacterium]